ncbi:hypothetical protein JCM10207_000052 [Rhodosporidiobolus poonsookiae]
MDDDPPTTGFARADDFILGAHKLCQLAFDVEPAQEVEQDEVQLLNELCGMLDGYQEQPQLLDPSLEALVSPLLLTLREQVRRRELPLSSKRLNRLARLVYFVTKVRGAKVVVRFFPHETSDLSLLLPLLSSTFSPSADPTPSTSSRSLTSASWELRYLLLLWLSVVIRLPFDLARLGPDTAETMQRVGFEALALASKEGDAAQEVLARFYSRQDAPLENLIAACEKCFSSMEQPTLVTAHLSLLSSVLRNARPASLLAHWSALYHLLAYLPTDTSKGKGGALMAKMRCKVAGRLALLKFAEAKERGEVGEEDVPEATEVIVGELIETLGHSDTLPRYSSAKYLARLCSSLPSAFSAQVVDAVLSTLSDALAEANEQGMADRAEGKVQGACLACGEMARRGLIGTGEGGEEQVERVVDGVLQALAFDHLHLSRSLGTSARDSAAYVLWSLSRTLPTSLAQPHAPRIAERLVCTALFDREVQVRRAASAAFQEGVGRWSVFPHGIDVLRMVDFFTVSVRHRAYLQAAPSVAAHAEYRPSILAHLVETGISHYDSDIRALGAKALGSVVELDDVALGPSLIAQQIEKLAKTKDSATLHGLLLSLASLAKAVAGLPADEVEMLRNQIFHATTSLLLPCARQLKSSSPVLAAALAALAASAPSPSSALPAEWFEMLLKACETADEEVHVRAGEAVQAVSRAVGGVRQQAAVLMLGKIEYGTISDDGALLIKVAERLARFVQREGSGKAATIEARRNGVDALSSLVCRYNISPSLAPLLPALLDALHLGFSDYTTDQRGDVGSWVRIVTLQAWAALLPALLSTSVARPLEQDRLDRVVAAMAKQAVERLDNVREVAGTALVGIWAFARKQKEEGGLVVLRKSEVWESIEAEPRLSWRDQGWASERILPLLEVEEYRAEVLEGAVLAASQYSTSTPFLDYALSLPALSDFSSPSSSLLDLLRALYTLGKTHFASNRLFLPFLSILSSLAEAGCLDEVALDESGEGAKVLRNSLGLATNAVGKMKSAPRLTASGKVLIAFLALPHVGPFAADRLPLYLSHSQPWLRQQVADDLFGQLSVLTPDGDEELEGLLAETAWTTAGYEEAAQKVAELVKKMLLARERWY